MENKIKDLWEYYQFAIAPCVQPFLSEKLGSLDNNKEVVHTLLSGTRIDSKLRKQISGIDGRFSESQTLRELVQAARSEFNEEVCYFFQ